MRKLILCLIICSSVLLSCSTKKENKNKVTITFETFEWLPVQQKWMKEFIKRFEQEHPGIEVKMQFAADNRKVLVEIAGGTAPDVFFGGNWDGPNLVLKKSVIDLMPYIKEDKLDLNQYFTSLIEIFKYDEGLYAFPVFGMSFGLVYNKKIFDQNKYPYPDENWTLDDFLKAAIALTKRDANGKIIHYGTLRPHSWNTMLSNGGKIFDFQNKKFVINSKQNIETVQFLTDLEKKYKVCPGEAEIQQWGKGGIIPLFTTGKIAMYVCTSTEISEFKKTKNLEWGIVPIPKGKKGRIIGIGVGCLYIASQSKHKKEAWEFVKSYCGETGQTLFAEIAAAGVPSLKKVAYSIYSGPGNEKNKVFIDALNYLTRDANLHKLPFWMEIETNIFTPGLDLIYMQKKTVEKGLEEINNRANELIK